MADGAEVIKQLTSGGLQHVGLALALVAIGVDDDLDAILLNAHVDVLACHDRLAVVVDNARVGAMDMEVARAETLNLGTHVERLAEHVDGYLGRLENVERLHDDNIHQPVAHRRLWGDISVVAVLRRIGAGDEKRLVVGADAVGVDLVGLGLVLGALLKYFLQIGDGTSLAGLGELLADESVEAHTAGAEERILVDDAVVEVVHLVTVNDLNAFAHIERQQQVTGQSVARPTRNDAQRRVGVDDAPRHLVDGAIAADGHHHIHTLHAGVACYRGRVTGILRLHDAVLILVVVEIRLDGLWYARLAGSARYGIDDKKDAFLHIAKLVHFL